MDAPPTSQYCIAQDSPLLKSMKESMKERVEVMLGHAGLPLAGKVPCRIGVCGYFFGRLLCPVPHPAAAVAGLRRLLGLHQVRCGTPLAEANVKIFIVLRLACAMVHLTPVSFVLISPSAHDTPILSALLPVRLFCFHVGNQGCLQNYSKPGMSGCRRVQLSQVVFSWGIFALRRLQQERLMKKQGAKEKLRRLVAPLLGVAGQGSSLAFKAFSSIRPRISLRFEGIGVTLRDGTVILDSVNGHFSHSKVGNSHHSILRAASNLSLDHSHPQAYSHIACILFQGIYSWAASYGLIREASKPE